MIYTAAGLHSACFSQLESSFLFDEEGALTRNLFLSLIVQAVLGIFLLKIWLLAGYLRPGVLLLLLWVSQHKD